jgi:hypothetical protein
MTQGANESLFPSLFSHRNRKDWGVGVLAWEADGKRGYLFENGEERTMASDFFELMRRVEHPSAEQEATCARLLRILAARASAADSERLGATFADFIEKFRETYEDGFQDEKWILEVRGQDADRRAPGHRDAMIREAKEQLSAANLDALISGHKYEQLWNQVTSVLARTDLVPAAQLKKPKAPAVEQQRTLAIAARDLLYGNATYDQRLQRYLGALTAFYGEPARWELSTALSALVHPTEHVCVHPPVFRQQLKATGSRSTIPARPSSAAYAKLLIVARFVGSQLVAQGEAPRDLFDVHDFIRIAFKAPTKTRVAKPKGPASRRSSDEDENTTHDNDDE